MKYIYLILVFFLLSCSTQPCDLDGDGEINLHERKVCSKNNGGESFSNDVVTNTSAVIAHIGIHLETEHDQVALEYQETYWVDIFSLVELADTYDFSLTIKMTPQWAEFIGNDDGRVQTVLSWTDRHELGVHHHGTSHMAFDGYSNSGEADNVGNINDMMGLYAWYDEWFVYSGTDEDMDLPNGILYETQGYPANSCCLLSSITENEVGLLELSTRGYMTGKSGEASLNDIKNAIEDSGGQYVGVTLTDVGYSENKGEVVKLFDLLAQHNVTVLTVSEIMSTN